MRESQRGRECSGAIPMPRPGIDAVVVRRLQRKNVRIPEIWTSSFMRYEWARRSQLTAAHSSPPCFRDSAGEPG